MVDILLRGGLVVDGTGKAPFEADVAVVDGRITAVGDLSSLAESPGVAEVIDVTGHVVAPGFIDVHTHSDLATFLPEKNQAVTLASVMQGVTTEVTGNCGWTPFPAVPARRDDIARHVASVFGPAARAFDTLADYREVMAERELPVNFAPLVGHGTIRATVLGFDRIAADDAALTEMGRVLNQALDHGAFGMSSGLVYPPAVYSDRGELVALGEVLARRGSIYTTHMRNEMELVIEAVDEGIDVARRTGVPVQLSHIKVAGKERWGSVDRVLDRIDLARRDGFDVAGDVYPYTAGSTLLRAVLPPWANEGGVAAMLERLGDRAVRDRIAAEYESGLPGWQNFVGAAGWPGITIASAPARTEIEGRSIADLAEEAGKSGAETAADLLVELDGEIVVVLHMMSEGDVQTLLADDGMLIGSDTIPLPGNPHPRTAGTFARVLGHYVRDQQLADLAAMVKRMTSVPAERFRLGRRGTVAEGWIADLVVFDPAAVLDRATYDDPLQSADGIRHVVISGLQVVRDGRDTGARPGTVLEPA
ncbi:MAG: D-aminoacylase [Nitriliruptoraceae bacterium]